MSYSLDLILPLTFPYLGCYGTYSRFNPLLTLCLLVDIKPRTLILYSISSLDAEWYAKQEVQGLLPLPRSPFSY